MKVRSVQRDSHTLLARGLHESEECAKRDSHTLLARGLHESEECAEGQPYTSG
jgi:hypothetical protein